MAFNGVRVHRSAAMLAGRPYCPAASEIPEVGIMGVGSPRHGMILPFRLASSMRKICIVIACLFSAGSDRPRGCVLVL